MAKNVILTNKQWFDQNVTDAAELQTLSTPALEKRMAAEGRHRPVPHFEILTKFRDKATALGLQLTNEQGRLKRDGERYMYTAEVVDNSHPDFALSVGFVNHNDKSKAFQGMLGSQIFVCCNGVCHGVVIPSRIRHTKNNVDAGLVTGKVDTIFDRFLAERGDVVGQIDLLKNTKLTDRLLGDFVLKLTREHKVGNKNILELVNLCDDPTQMIMDEVENPTLNLKDDNSAFRLLNACSYVTTHRLKNPAAQASTSKFFNDTLLSLIKPDFKRVGDIVEVEELEAAE